jgi:hypothetical protein
MNSTKMNSTVFVNSASMNSASLLLNSTYEQLDEQYTYLDRFSQSDKTQALIPICCNRGTKIN